MHVQIYTADASYVHGSYRMVAIFSDWSEFVVPFYCCLALAASGAVAKGLSRSAEKAGGLLERGGQKLRTHLERPDSEHRSVDPRLVKGAAYARRGSDAMVHGIEIAVSGLGSAIRRMSQLAAPHVQRTTQELMPRSWTEPTEDGGPSKASSAMSVAAATIEGGSTIFSALEQSACTLGRSATKGTTDVVQGRYGNATGAVTQDMMYSVGNAGMAVYNLTDIGVVDIAGTMGAETVHQIDRLDNESSSEPLSRTAEERQEKQSKVGPQKQLKRAVSKASRYFWKKRPRNEEVVNVSNQK